MENETQEKKRRRWEWIPFLLAMLLSFFCVFTATAMALMSQPDKLNDASMLPVGTANYGQLDSEKLRFGQLDDAIFADATQDSAGLNLTPGSSGEASGNRKTPVFIAFVTPVPSNTPVPSPVVVTMNAPGTAVPTYAALPTATTAPTATDQYTPSATSTSQATITATPTRWSSPTTTATSWPTSTPTNVPAPTITSHTPKPTSTRSPVLPTATNTAIPTNTATAVPPASTNTPTSVPSTATYTPTNTATAVPPTATHTATAVPPTATNTATPVPPTATNTATPVPPTATATTASVRVLSVALVNAEDNDNLDDVIPGYETMPDGITLDLSLLPTVNLNIWATLDPQTAHHVDVTLTGAMNDTHRENHYPYTFPGNNGADFHAFNFVPGAYTLTFEPYVDATTPGTPFVFNFTVVDSSARLSIRPILECVLDNGGGWYTAFFGYQNDNSFVVNIPLGVNNRFSPDPPFRGQSSNFDPGVHNNIVTTNFPASESVSWNLDGNGVTANSSSSLCP